MAIGASLLFNIRLPINFYSPYRAVNIIDIMPEKDQDGNVVMKEQVTRHRFEFKREGSDVWEDVEIIEERSNA
jgi:hypothetical protein